MMRVEGLDLWVHDGGVCEEVNKRLGLRYHNHDLIFPNSAFTKEYRRHKDAACTRD